MVKSGVPAGGKINNKTTNKKVISQMVAAANHNNINKMKTTTKTQFPNLLKNKWKKLYKRKKRCHGTIVQGKKWGTRVQRRSVPWQKKQNFCTWDDRMLSKWFVNLEKKSVLRFSSGQKKKNCLKNVNKISGRGNGTQKRKN